MYSAIISALYLPICYALHLACKRITIQIPKYILTLYNGLQIVANAIVFAAFCPYLHFPTGFEINVTYDDHISFWLCMHLYSKFFDYIDTFVIILRKKQHQLTFLHLFHHATIPLVWLYLIHIGHANGTIWFGAWVNSLVHIIMYSYYLLTVTTRPVNRSLKKAVTHLQLTQFCLCVIHAVFACVYERIVPPHLPYIQLLYHVIMISLFTGFYKKAYTN